MSRRNKIAAVAAPVVRTTWCWRRWINSGQEYLWMERIRAKECLSWALMERPQRSRILLEAYTGQRSTAISLTRKFGGRVRRVHPREWSQSIPMPPTRIGRRLQIVHAKIRSRNGDLPQLHIPHGMAFGSGEHATTHMLLQALTRYEGWKSTTLGSTTARRTTVLDLGTGSGILALAARLLGAGKVVAADFDPDAVRTARQNEALNFSTPLIRWRCADVKRLRIAAGYDLVLANLFSGILCEAASQIAGSVATGGQLWLSGVLQSQQMEVLDAYRRQRLQLLRTVNRGKWVLLQLQERSGLGVKKTTQIK